MARDETNTQYQTGGNDAGDQAQTASEAWQGFPRTAIEDRPGHERSFPLNRIERIIGSIM